MSECLHHEGDQRHNTYLVFPGFVKTSADIAVIAGTVMRCVVAGQREMVDVEFDHLPDALVPMPISQVAHGISPFIPILTLRLVDYNHCTDARG